MALFQVNCFERRGRFLSMKPNYLLLAAINGFLVVLLGAFGAHALETRVSADMLEVWHTAVQYQMFHTAGLIALGFLQRVQTTISDSSLAVIGYCFVAGIVLFSGSLYLLALTQLRWLGMITPVGGVLFLAAWLQMARVCYRLHKQ